MTHGHSAVLHLSPFFPPLFPSKFDLFYLLIIDVEGQCRTWFTRRHTQHTRYDSPRRVISPSQRPLPDNTQHSQQTDIHAPRGIRIQNPNKRAATDPHLRIARPSWPIGVHITKNVLSPISSESNGIKSTLPSILTRPLLKVATLYILIRCKFLWCVCVVGFGHKILICNINLLKPTGHVMHQQFNIQQLYVLPSLYLCVLYLSENKQRLVPLTA